MDFLTADPVSAFISAFFGMNESPAPLLPLLTLYNQTIAAILGVVMFYVIAAAVVKTSSDGKVAGTAPGAIRFFIAAALIIPAPTGLTAGQILFGNALNLSVDGAKNLYAKADEIVRRQGQPLVMPNDPHAYSLALDISAFFVCNELVFQNEEFAREMNYARPGTQRFYLAREISDEKITYTHVYKASAPGEPATERRGYCGTLTVSKTGDGIAHEAAFRSRVEAIETLEQKLISELDTKLVRVDLAATREEKNAAQIALIDSIARAQEIAYNTLLRAHTEQSAAAWRDASGAKSEKWRGGFIDIGADMYSLHRAQVDVMRAALPGAVSVEPADMKTTLALWTAFQPSFLSQLEEQMRAKYARPVFNTDSEAAAVGRQTATTWLAGMSKILKGAVLGVAGVDSIKTGAKEIAENARAHFLLATKTMFLNTLKQPWAEVAASPFGAVAALGAPLLEAGRYLTAAGGVASFVPGLGNIGMLGLVAGFALMLVGGICVYLMPLFPALLWLSVTATVFVGAFIAVVIIPIIALRMIHLDGDSIFADRGEAWKPVIYYASLPALAALGLLSFSFLFGAIIAAGNAGLLRAIGNEIEAGSVDAWSWLWWSAAYVIFVVIGGGFAAFKATWGLADYVAKTVGVSVPNHASDDGSRLAAVGYMSSRRIVNQTSNSAAQTTASLARAAGGAVSGGGAVAGGGGGGGGVAAGLRNARNTSQSASDQQIDVGKFVVKNASKGE